MDMTQVFGFIWNGCIHESASGPMSLHRTKKGAYKAMNSYLNKEFMKHRDEQLLYGKGHVCMRYKFGAHCAWAVHPIEIQE